jgi:hypothetical protein
LEGVYYINATIKEKSFKEKTILNWSGGKDAAFSLVLNFVSASPRYR